MVKKYFLQARWKSEELEEWSEWSPSVELTDALEYLCDQSAELDPGDYENIEDFVDDVDAINTLLDEAVEVDIVNTDHLRRSFGRSEMATTKLAAKLAGLDHRDYDTALALVDDEQVFDDVCADANAARAIAAGRGFMSVAAAFTSAVTSLWRHETAVDALWDDPEGVIGFVVGVPVLVNDEGVFERTPDGWFDEEETRFRIAGGRWLDIYNRWKDADIGQLLNHDNAPSSPEGIAEALFLYIARNGTNDLVYLGWNFDATGFDKLTLYVQPADPSNTRSSANMTIYIDGEEVFSQDGEGWEQIEIDISEVEGETELRFDRRIESIADETREWHGVTRIKLEESGNG